MNIKVIIPGLTTAGLIKEGFNKEHNATCFIAYSDQMKARVLEQMAMGAVIKVETTTENWYGERACTYNF